MAVIDAVADPAEVRQRLAAVTFRPVWAILSAVAAAHLLGLSLSPTARYGLLLATLVVLGLPHGALDHLTLPRARDRPLTARGLARFCALYLLAAGVYAIAWLFAPAASFVGFILLTWFHWGQGDRAHLALVTGAAHLEDPWVNRLTVLVRGGLPMVVPLVGFPDRYQSVLSTVVGLFDPGGGAWLDPLFTPSARLAIGVGFGVVTIGTLLGGYLATADRHGWLLDAAETTLLWVYFLAVPPVLAIGVYFAVWHSLRHLARLVVVDNVAASALAVRSNGRLLWRVTRDALPMTAGALLLFGGLAVLVPNDPGSIEAVGGVYLVLLAVLTLPHALVVSVLDRVQGVVP